MCSPRTPRERSKAFISAFCSRNARIVQNAASVHHLHTPRRSARRRRKTPLGMRTRTASNERMRSGRPAKSARNTNRLGISTHRCDANDTRGHGGRESVERARGAGHNLGVIHINSRALCSMVLYPVSIPARLVEKSSPWVHLGSHDGLNDRSFGPATLWARKLVDPK